MALTKKRIQHQNENEKLLQEIKRYEEKKKQLREHSKEKWKVRLYQNKTRIFKYTLSF